MRILNERRCGSAAYELLSDEQPTEAELLASQRRMDGRGHLLQVHDIKRETINPADKSPPIYITSWTAAGTVVCTRF